MSVSVGQRQRTASIQLTAAVVLLTAGCSPPSNEVVVYCSLDREFSEPILERFERETGITVRAKYDTESTKSVGLAQQILREKPRPRCDVFWNNEVLNTVRLAEAGVLEAYDSSVGKEYPATFRSADKFWYGFAGRARVLIVNTEKTEPAVIPHRLEELTLPRWRGRVGIAKPLFGTTATQVACLFAALGPEKAKDLLRRLKANGVQVLPGNKQVAVQVGAGALELGLTDTDDALAEIRAHRPVRMIFLEDVPDGLGVLLIPNTVALVRGAGHPEAARRLMDFLLSPEVEKELALGESAQIPLHPRTNAVPGLGLSPDAKRMQVDYAAAAHAWDEAMKFVQDEFTVP